MEMRLLSTLSLIVLLSAFAVGQVAIVGGTATSAGYEVYTGPYVPRVVTPSISLVSNPDGSTQAVVYPAQAATPLLYVQGGSSMRPAAARSGDLMFSSVADQVSAKQLMAWSGPAKKASRTYTNSDVDRFNQGTGTVKYNGKTEQMK
jgi:hypothetical protein